MSIQQTVNQGLAVVGALGTQTASYQEKVEREKGKLAKQRDEKEYKQLDEKMTKELKAQIVKNEPATPEFHNKMADIWERKNFLKPNEKTAQVASLFRQLANETQRQDEANMLAEIQKQAKIEQRKKIGEMIMKV